VPGPITLNSQVDGSSPYSYVGSSMAYAILYSALLLLFAALIFRRRDFL
jgi:ABC-type transport system involved in multi-copper enzyme maturation permease subunit